MKIKKKTTTKKPVNNLKGKIKIFFPPSCQQEKNSFDDYFRLHQNILFEITHWKICKRTIR